MSDVIEAGSNEYTGAQLTVGAKVRVSLTSTNFFSGTFLGYTERHLVLEDKAGELNFIKDYLRVRIT